MSLAAAEALQPLEIPDGVVELFDIDLSVAAAGAPVLRLTPWFEGPGNITTGGTMISRGGNVYTPAPITLSGFAMGGEGAPPQPILSVGNARHTLSAWVWSGHDLKGAEVTRYRVLDRWLDGYFDEDSARAIQEDRWRIEQKVRQKSESIEFRLASQFDFGNKQLPGRVMHADSCSFRYREWDGAAFTNFDCPYTGTSYFDVYGATTTEANDVCARRLLTGCRLRFPSDPLPITAFPGLGRRR